MLLPKCILDILP